MSVYKELGGNDKENTMLYLNQNRVSINKDCFNKVRLDPLNVNMQDNTKK